VPDITANATAVSFENLGAAGFVFWATKHGVENLSVLKVGRHLNVCDCDKPKVWVFHRALKRFGNQNLDSLGKPAGSGVINHG
jgi:hypothetical protein